MGEEPSYLSTLNAIANGERRGFQFLDAWSPKTRDPQPATLLRQVAIRETEHAATFEKRISKLWRDMVETSDDGFEDTMGIATSDPPDSEKFEQLGVGPGVDDEDGDHLLQLLTDTSIDPATEALLGRFIAEECDSHRLLHAAYQHACGHRPLKTQEQAQSATLEQLSSQLQQRTTAVAEIEAQQKK